MNECLDEAKTALHIKSVNLKSAVVFIADDIEPFEFSGKNFSVQTFRYVKMIKTIELDSDFLYCFHYHTGIRLSLKTEESNTPESEKDIDTPVIVEIKAVHGALYNSEKELDDKSIHAFSENNVGYHVWPYWREFVHSSCARIGIPSLDVPFYLIHKG